MQSLNQTTDEFFYFILLNFFLFCSLNEKRTSCSVAFAWKYPPFRLIKLGHREETFLKGIEQRQQNIRTTVENSESPTFKNVILACDSSTLIFDYIFWAFFVLKETETTGKHIDLSTKGRSDFLSSQWWYHHEQRILHKRTRWFTKSSARWS